MTAHSLAETTPQVGIDQRDYSTVSDFFQLLKPGVMSLVVFTSLAGMLLAPHSLHPFIAFVVILSVAMGSGASGAINMWFDADIDKIMRRTQKRPIPAGRMKRAHALEFGVFLSGLSVMTLYLATNLLAASILAFSIFFYVFIYTMWLKRSTPQNIVIGGAAGAFPPVIGWTAATGTLSLEPVLLFTIIFLWTPSHFWALALYKSQEYARAAVPMLPVVAGIESTKRQIFVYSLLLIGTTVLPLVFGFSSSLYGMSALVLGSYYMYLATKVLTSSQEKFARQLFGYSIMYLFLLFTALVVDKMVL